jgi:hypothetical protein
MTTHERIVAALLRLYPAEWRQEYGAEFSDMLLSRPPTAGLVVNVSLSGLRQRARYAAPATICGVVMMLVIAGGFGWNILASLNGGQGVAPMVRESGKTLPTLVVAPLQSEPYVLLMIACGWWTMLRYRGARSSGVAAMKLTFIAGIPVMIAGALMLAGVLGIATLRPNGPVPTTFTPGYGLVFQSPLAIFIAPLFRLPESWIWGAVGGWLGRRVSDYRPPDTVAS